MSRMTSPPTFGIHHQACSRPPSGRVMTPRVWWMMEGHNDARRSPKAAKPTPKRVATSTFAAVLGYLVDHPRPPLEIGHRIAAPSRFVVRLGAGFVWHVR